MVDSYLKIQSLGVGVELAPDSIRPRYSQSGASSTPTLKFRDSLEESAKAFEPVPRRGSLQQDHCRLSSVCW